MARVVVFRVWGAVDGLPKVHRKVSYTHAVLPRELDYEALGKCG